MKTTFYAFLFAALFVLSSNAQSQNTDTPYIEVIGTADMEGVPDMIYLKITLGEKNSGTKSKISIDEQEDSLKITLTKIKVDLSKLSLSDASSNYVKVTWGKNNVLTTKEYTLLLNDAESLGKTLQELDRLKVNSAYVNKVEHSEILVFKQQVRISAMLAAKAKADYLLNSIGSETGKPLIIREQQTIQPNYQYDGIRVRRARSSNNSVYINGDKKGIRNSISENKIRIFSLC